MMPMTAQCGTGVATGSALRICVFVRLSLRRLVQLTAGETAPADAPAAKASRPANVDFLIAFLQLFARTFLSPCRAGCQPAAGCLTRLRAACQAAAGPK